MSAIAITTAQELVTFAMRGASVLGVGQTALADDYEDVFKSLNAMLGQWNTKRWLIYQEVDLGIAVDGSRSYTIGPGGTFDTPRVDRLEAAYFRQFPTNNENTGPVDFPLQIIQSMEDYSQIALKNLTTWPVAIFLDSGNPIGSVFPVPIPNIVPSELHVVVKQHIPQFTSLAQQVSLPAEYTEALWTNLAVRICALYPGAILTPGVEGLAKASLSTIRVANTQIPRLQMPSGMVRPPLYNIYSGQRY